MMKWLTKLALIPLFAGSLLAEDWEMQSVFLDLGLGRSDAGGIHGLQVAPDGNVWVVAYGSVYGDTAFVDGDTIPLRPIWVLDESGNHASFSPIRTFDWADSTGYLVNSARGLSKDSEGNILYSYYNEVLKFNYQTGELMARNKPTYDEAGGTSSLTEATADADGNVYVSWVAGAGRPVVKISADFSSQSNVAESGVNYNRSTNISPSGERIFLGSTWGSGGVRVLESNALGTAFDSVDTYGGVEHTWLLPDSSADTTGTVLVWAEVLEFNRGVLWVGETDPGWYSSYQEGITSSHPYAGEWIGFDPNTGELIDNLGVGQSVSADDDASALAATGVTCNPRAMDNQDVDGTTLYVADFSTNVVQVWYNSDPVGLSIDDDSESSTPIIAQGYALYQAYPNPFNPQTKITYEIGSSGYAKVEIFNLKGELINTLVNGWHFHGAHEVVWNGRDNSDMQVPSGTYIYRLISSDIAFSKRVTLLK
ncbi:MAG TPA: T9SS type A sorting domain-containing protein [Candidatus Marinimicrobia bacterium]|jgi:hypothetical protein|nr:T9SS type A sorting domain-containing protein [Candidatus Neomarinimicrobiota bacterium]MDP7566251.1 T9SS type A sorting domain-containing protein [Candidatus Neomarinimicrobiota bacterium]HJL75460.1 T9SS type A sorting domain-containing protein [Candidatus Neomarinimicrobiota bacterium]HJM70511.1 T9SS type A sorting domain-containing protein [Candidatus Neomarinimicrobiota bacterium]|tara:strand:- start:5132 stop:6571 length:1440 start_codon:yes stop_codon:yes gene_type:complete